MLLFFDISLRQGVCWVVFGSVFVTLTMVSWVYVAA